MRHFYIFNISNEFRYNFDPYILYKIFDELHSIKGNNIKYGINIYNNLTKPFNKKIINNQIYNKFKNNESYTKFMNKHHINNYYNNEISTLIIKNSYIELNTSIFNSSFLSYLNKYDNLFVCDFENSDYFWIKSIA